MDNPDRDDVLMNTRQIPTDRRWFEIFDIISENLSSSWQNLALFLGVSRDTITRIENEYTKVKDKCWHTLMEWKAKTHPLRMQHQLVYTLNQIDHKRLADIVVMTTDNPDDVNKLLAPYLQREAQMREGFYVIADSIHRQWRRLAKTFGLSPVDVADIERSKAGRTREKCLNMLYKWRVIAGLKDYKMATLIQVLSSCGFSTLAGKLQLCDGTSDTLLRQRKKQKNEVIIFISVDVLEHQPLGRDTNPFITTKILKEYALNKIFIRFQDSLELQEKDKVHDLVRYFHRGLGAILKEVSRKRRTIVVKGQSRDQVDEIARRLRYGEISEKVTDLLVADDILEELGLTELKLKAEVYEYGAVTGRSEGQ
ncbi:hypothetical protein LSH36_330g11013 [Paralvinella palmiformis]|uniref:Death domain-containing protein n=1 Tax=Paralvinella palmiformis TaxID=53620 RepID=A0AAD9JGN0_9ANNE|nr:hypothetical protein LSH36_330g11013 [Paralvinella palmiformis]